MQEKDQTGNQVIIVFTDRLLFRETPYGKCNGEVQRVLCKICNGVRIGSPLQQFPEDHVTIPSSNCGVVK